MFFDFSPASRSSLSFFSSPSSGSPFRSARCRPACHRYRLFFGLVVIGKVVRYASSRYRKPGRATGSKTV